MTASLDRLQTRYADPDIAIPAVWSPVLDRLLDHRSVRAYLDKPLAPGTLEALVAAAQSASTSSNLQLWSLVVVKDPARKAALAALTGNQQHIIEAPVFLVWLADLSRVERLAERRSATLETLPYLESLLLGTIDAALAAQNAVVALESLGLGSVYVGAIRNHVDRVARLLKLPPLVFPVFGLSLGHPDPARPAKVKPRLPASAVVHHETYATDAEAAAIARYDAGLGDFYTAQGMKGGSWSEQVVNRLSGVSALHGREQLSRILKELGFGLK